MLNPQRYASALREFLELVDTVGQPRWLVAEHLRYPALDHSTLAGSALGRDIWESSAARALVDVLLEDENLRSWFSPPPASSLSELRSQLASLVASWDSSAATAEEFVSLFGDALREEIQSPTCTYSRVRVLYGVEIGDRIDLGRGVAVEPGTSEALRQLLTQWRGFERDVLRTPRGPFVLVLTSLEAERGAARCFAATEALAWTDILAENVRWDTWAATGILPRLGDAYAIAHATFPVHPSERFPASYREVFAGTTDHAAIEPSILASIHARMGALRGEDEDFPQEAMMPLWIANTFIHPAIDSRDPLMTVLLSYAGCEGMLLSRKDDDSRLGPRLAVLVGSDTAEERRIRKIVDRWRDLRGFAGHGQRPPIEALGGFLEEDIGAAGFPRAILGDERIRRAAAQRASRLFRRAFLAMLFSVVDVDDGRLRPRAGRGEVVEVLESAAAGSQDARAEIAERVPSFVREAGI